MFRIFNWLFFLTPFLLNAQRKADAFRTNEKILIDGQFTESDWTKAQVTGDFVQFKPNPGTQSTQQTEVRVMYDDNAIYVAAKCYDKPEHVSKVLSQRDDFNANVDNFQIFIDTYNDDQNAFTFGVSSMGVQYDAKQFVNDENAQLNMVWNSAAIRTEEGWQAEMRIPYSAFRFPKKEIQDWGVNFFRYISRNREESVWSPVKPDFDNWPAQFGSLTNIQGIEPPLRLALMPYVSAYVDHFPYNQTGVSNWSRSFNGGMDIKLGLNEAFTLDMTLVPDYRQVVFDNKVLNVSPFEIQFNENRQFFTEGTELFNKSGLFYSRRIGIQSPYAVLSTNLTADEYLTNVPASSQLYNASKVTGRTKKGLGIGVFNGITAEQSGTAVNSLTGKEREIITSPLSNYNVLVFDQNLKNNSYITLTNTNVMREGIFYDANVTGVNSKINFLKNKYYVSGRTAVSNKMYSTDVNTGHNWGIGGGKQTGKLVVVANYFEESNTYDPNDLGFNANNNKRSIDMTASYRIYQPFWKIIQTAVTSTFTYSRLYKPDVFTYLLHDLKLFALVKGFHATGMSVNSSLTEGYDYFEPRSEGRYFLRPKWSSINYWISSNYQKRFALDGSVNYTLIDRDSWTEYGYSISPRLRVSDNIFLVYEFERSFSKNGQGYAVEYGTPAFTSGNIVFGSRDRINTTNTIDLTYTMTNRMGITFRLRHYRSSLEYNYFYDLLENGQLISNTMTGLDLNNESAYNTNFNAFTIDFVYRWVFQPGSEINIVWKNSIFSEDKIVDASYFNNLSNILDYSPMNSFSVKILYWLDYQSLKKRQK
jgi:hypothetical protein